jgi:hypothetical protein
VIFETFWRTASENAMYANFVEFYKGEVRRIPIPRTRVNKGKKKRKGRGLLLTANPQNSFASDN